MSPDPDLEQIARDLALLRKAVRTNSPLLRWVADSPFFAWLSIPFGLFILGFGIGTHALLLGHGSWSALPPTWKALLPAVLILFATGGGVAKYLVIDRRVKSRDRRSSFWTILRLLYGGMGVSLRLPIVLALVGVSAFAIARGHPWYILSSTAVFYGFIATALGSVLERPEYPASGWYALVSGLLSLFFVETAPWLWVAGIWGMVFLVFAAVSLLRPAEAAGGEESHGR